MDNIDLIRLLIRPICIECLTEQKKRNYKKWQNPKTHTILFSQTQNKKEQIVSKSRKQLDMNQNLSIDKTVTHRGNNKSFP